MSNVTTTTCPRCSQRVRIAAERMPKPGQTLGLVCPKCRDRWRWSPAGHAAMRELNFQCAHSGQGFSVLYAKEGRDTKFRVRAIEETGAVIKRLLGSTAARATKAHAAGPVGAGTWAATDFDHSGWRCPHCRGRGRSVDSFVQCGSCHRLVCGDSMIQVHGGGRTFRCLCGAHAEVRDGLIAAFSGKMSDVAFRPHTADARVLPTQSGGGMPELGRGDAAGSSTKGTSWRLLPWGRAK